jgi:hypothetical protein
MDFPLSLVLGHRAMISSASDECTASDILLAGLDLTGGPGLTVNQAYYLPLVIQSKLTITRLGYGVGNPVSGSVDLGLYERDGTRLVSTGSDHADQLGQRHRRRRHRPHSGALLHGDRDERFGPARGHEPAHRELAAFRLLRDQDPGLGVSAARDRHLRAAGLAAEAAADRPLEARLGDLMDFPIVIPPLFISSFSRYCVKEWGKLGLGPPTETVYPAANRAFFIPMTIPFAFNAQRAFVANGAGVSGSFDLGVYSIKGTKIFSTGSTVQGPLGSPWTQFVTLSPDWLIPPGSYYLAFVLDNTAGHISRTVASGVVYKASGIAKMDTAFPLPDSATLVAAENYIPLFGLTSTTSGV